MDGRGTAEFAAKRIEADEDIKATLGSLFIQLHSIDFSIRIRKPRERLTRLLERLEDLRRARGDVAHEIDYLRAGCRNALAAHPVKKLFGALGADLRPEPTKALLERHPLQDAEVQRVAVAAPAHARHQVLDGEEAALANPVEPETLRGVVRARMR